MDDLSVLYIVLAFFLGLFLNGGWIRKYARAVFRERAGDKAIIEIRNLCLFTGENKQVIDSGPYAARQTKPGSGIWIITGKC